MEKVLHVFMILPSLTSSNGNCVSNKKNPFSFISREHNANPQTSKALPLTSIQ